LSAVIVFRWVRLMWAVPLGYLLICMLSIHENACTGGDGGCRRCQSIKFFARSHKPQTAKNDGHGHDERKIESSIGEAYACLTLLAFTILTMTGLLFSHKNNAVAGARDGGFVLCKGLRWRDWARKRKCRSLNRQRPLTIVAVCKITTGLPEDPCFLIVAEGLELRLRLMPYFR